MSTRLKVFVTIVIVLMVAVAVNIFMSKIYYPELPVPNLSKAKADQILFTSNGRIVQLSEDNQHIWYGFKGNQLDGSNALILELAKEGWTFVDQLGSGYFFYDSMQNKKTVESQMWTRKYVIYKVQK